MIEFLLIGLLNCFVIIGFHMAVQYQWNERTKIGGRWVEGYITQDSRNILWFVKWHTRKFPVWITKPLYDCPRCMATIHSTYIYFLFGQPLIYYPVYILMLSGMIEIVTRKFEI